MDKCWMCRRAVEFVEGTGMWNGTGEIVLCITCLARVIRLIEVAARRARRDERRRKE